ncbi:MAG: PAS domain S-box protein, partial [bacterium]|nr:PAS domain S-box protein [bacterium]
VEYRYKCKDGNFRPIELTAANLLHDPLINGILANYHDITNRKKAEQELLESKEFNEKIISESPIGIVIYDETGQCIAANDSLGKMIGATKKQVLAQNYTKLESWQKYGLLDTAKKALHDNETKFHFSKVITTFGKYVYLEYYFVPFKRAGRNYIMLMANDITERKKTEEALRDSEVNLKEAQNVANMGSWVWDLKTNFVTWSDNLCRIHGMKPEEFDGTFETATSLIHPDDLEKVHANIKLGQIEKIPFESEYRIITKDGIMKFVLGTIKLIFDDKGNVIKMVGTLQDITERRRLEEQLQIRQRMDSLGTLAGGIAHDFNNILVGILGNIDLLTLNNENFTPDQKECLTDAGKSCNRAANLIRQFQTLSTGAVRGKTAVDIHDISKEVFSLLKETTDRLITKQIKFKKGEYYVEANSGELHQVLLNLATNSAQAIEERGAYEGDYIRIQAENYEVTTGDRTGLTEGDYVHITIEDSGVGMSEVVLKKAFDPMFSTKDKGVRKGQGLGLAMVYNIISRIYNGHTYIDSKEGKGTTLHIYLPKAQPVDKVEKEKAVDIKGGTETILVVDDEENVRKFTKKLLTQVGYTVITASDGREALKIYKKQKDSIDTVILDLTMPQMSGKQVFQEMLDINPDVKVIISSGHGDEYSKKGILAEAKGNVGKPYKMKALAREVRKVLDS